MTDEHRRFPLCGCPQELTPANSLAKKMRTLGVSVPDAERDVHTTTNTADPVVLTTPAKKPTTLGCYHGGTFPMSR